MGFQPFNKTCPPRSINCSWHGVTFRFIGGLLSFEATIVKISFLYTCFSHVFYDKLTVLTIFLVYLACAAFIFACKRFVHAVFHDVTEIVQGMGTVVGYGIIVVEAYDFPIIAVKDFKVIIENQSRFAFRFPYFLPVAVCQFQNTPIEKFLRTVSVLTFKQTLLP